MPVEKLPFTSAPVASSFESCPVEWFVAKTFHWKSKQTPVMYCEPVPVSSVPRSVPEALMRRIRPFPTPTRTSPFFSCAGADREEARKTRTKAERTGSRVHVACLDDPSRVPAARLRWASWEVRMSVAHLERFMGELSRDATLQR